MTQKRQVAAPAQPQPAQAVSTEVTSVETRQLQQSAIKTLAERLGVDASGAFLASLRNVAFRSPDISNEQLMALVIVANQYKLNPFTKEIYAFPDKKTGGIVPVVSIDGWLRIINERPELDGLEYEDTLDDKGFPITGKCTIYRKDRTHPYVISEYFTEVKRSIDTWQQYPRRMLRWKTIIQCARVAFGFAGIYEPDEGERIAEMNAAPRVVSAQHGEAAVAALLAQPHNAGGKIKDSEAYVVGEKPADPATSEDKPPFDEAFADTGGVAPTGFDESQEEMPV